MPLRFEAVDDLLGTSHPDTEAYRVYLSLRRDIRSGLVEPCQRLRTEWLKSTYKASTSPLREALARLNAEHYVTAEGKRGFRVTDLDHNEYLSLIDLRHDVESSALRKSIDARTEDWEGRVLLAHHSLTKARIENLSDLDKVENREDRHRRFHLELLSGCNSSWLLRICDQLSSHAERYRRVLLRGTTIAPSYFDAVDGEHRDLFDYAMDGDADSAVDLLVKHRERSTIAVLNALEQPKKSVKLVS